VIHGQLQIWYILEPVVILVSLLITRLPDYVTEAALLVGRVLQICSRTPADLTEIPPPDLLTVLLVPNSLY
jgi:hypothetical protein